MVDHEIFSKQYDSSDNKITRYCTVRKEGGFDWPTTKSMKWRAVIQLIHVHADNEERIRFGYYHAEQGFIARPLEIAEDLLPALLEGACEAGVLSKDTIRSLKTVLKKFA